MNKELQRRNWACLPKETRDKVKVEIRQKVYPVKNYLIDIFGYHNIISDTEPEEMLHARRTDVMNAYKFATRCSPSHHDKDYWDGVAQTLGNLFGDKCLPDEDPETKSKEAKETQNLSLPDEQSTENKEPMEEKELNLCELLKGCEGEEFFSISVGKVMFKAIYDYDDTHKIRTVRKDAVGNEHNVNFHSDGRRNNAGLQDLYPSEDLLRKYPLNAAMAWSEWEESRKQTQKCHIHVDIVIDKADESFEGIGMDFEFESEEEAQQASEVVKEALVKFHEQNVEK